MGKHPGYRKWGLHLYLLQKLGGSIFGSSCDGVGV